MASNDRNQGFVADGRRRAIEGIEAELARNPRFGEDRLDDPEGDAEAESQPRGIWRTVRGWLRRRTIRRTIFDKLAPPDALY